MFMEERNWRAGVLAVAVAVVCGLSMGASGCQRTEADFQERQATNQLTERAFSTVGMPAIKSFTEKKFLKYLYELRDDPTFKTYTYNMDMTGRLHHICDSVGYGIPYSMQFSNPEKRAEWGGAGDTIPQAEPNGLFIPEGLSATWVLCTVPQGTPGSSGGVLPFYVEDTIIVSPVRLNAVDSYIPASAPLKNQGG